MLKEDWFQISDGISISDGRKTQCDKMTKVARQTRGLRPKRQLAEMQKTDSESSPHSSFPLTIPSLFTNLHDTGHQDGGLDPAQTDPSRFVSRYRSVQVNHAASCV
ncbi:hypothetical protein QCA50_006798 [Cerrena zonata]|uniref:Uncharacterized protein n=1 Tax=Cerrena zonata TaxID=2478898 RepID=A0AAW0GEB2_9APHY